MPWTNLKFSENFDILFIENEKRLELLCHKENYQMYQEEFEKKNSLIINKYLAKIYEVCYNNLTVKTEFSERSVMNDDKESKNNENSGFLID